MWGTSKLWVVALLAAALLVVGCGGGAASGEADPASVVPADATMYAEVVVRPEGSLRDGAHAAAGKLLLTSDPEAELRRLVERASEDVEFDYDRDVAPWLGERAGVWARPGDERFGLLVLAATDLEAARTALEDSLRRGGQRFSERSYGGTEYLLDDEGLARGIVGDLVAIGPEAAFKRAVDASEGDSLAETSAYADAVEALEDDRLAHVWFDTARAFEAAEPELPGSAALLPLDDLPPVVAGLAADGDALTVEARARARDRVDLGVLAGGGTPLLRELPGDTWLAFGATDVGESLRETIDNLAGAFGGIAVRREVRRQTGLDLDRDLLDWVGDVAFFVRGTTDETLDGGVVIQPTDERRAADAFGRIVGAIQVVAKVSARPVDVAGADQAFEIVDARSPHPVVLARGSGLVTITAGRAAAEAALGAGDRLGERELYAEAEDLIGMEPSALLSMPELLRLGAAGEPDPDSDRARPYLEAFTVIALGVTRDGDDGVARVAAGLR